MRRVRVGRGWTMVAGAGLLVLVVAGALVGLRAPGRATGPKESGTVSRQATPAADAAPSAVTGAGSSGASGADQSQIAPVPPGGGPSPIVPGGPRIVRTADLRVKVAKGGFGSAFDRVASVAAANGGFVSTSSTATSGGVPSGDLTVRVPSDRFDSVRQALAGLGKVEAESIRGEDVSGQLVDFDARLKSLQAQEDALRTLVSQAKAVGDVLSVQSNLFSVRQQIEQLKAQQANLDQAASLATIQVSLFEPGAPSPAPPVDDRSLAHSFARARDGMVAVLGGMVVVVGWLVPVATLGLLVWGATRLRRPRPPAQVPAT
jgi:hypothetical protein